MYNSDGYNDDGQSSWEYKFSTVKEQQYTETKLKMLKPNSPRNASKETFLKNTPIKFINLKTVLTSNIYKVISKTNKIREFKTLESCNIGWFIYSRYLEGLGETDLVGGDKNYRLRVPGFPKGRYLKVCLFQILVSPLKYTRYNIIVSPITSKTYKAQSWLYLTDFNFTNLSNGVWGPKNRAQLPDVIPNKTRIPYKNIFL